MNGEREREGDAVGVIARVGYDFSRAEVVGVVDAFNAMRQTPV